MQFKMNYPNVTVAVDANRRNGIQQLQDQEQKPEVIILDDAFQHRKVKAGLQIVLTAYDNLYVNDCMLPTGDLREPKSGAKRADVIVVTKCPKTISAKERVEIENLLKLEANQKLFFSYIDYATEVKNEVESIDFELYLKEEFTLVTGIANPKPLVNYLKGKNAKFKHLSFSDHHNFSDNFKRKIRLLTYKEFFY